MKGNTGGMKRDLLGLAYRPGKGLISKAPLTLILLCLVLSGSFLGQVYPVSHRPPPLFTLGRSTFLVPDNAYASSAPGRLRQPLSPFDES